ncbi:MAG TPA: PA14 domain-containing protein, partial [Polyangia bacterium]|nr:PA14 domain-containing protein [Polyangia bacterium]
NWGTGAPDPALPADAFSARWTGQLVAPETGPYVFQTISDEGVRLWLDGTLLVDNFFGHRTATDTTAAIALAAGQGYDVKVEYFEGTGPALMAFSWQTPGAAAFAAIPAAQLRPQSGPGGLGAQYFANTTLTGPPVTTHVEAVNFDWGYAPPEAGLPSDNFSVRWTGTVIAPATGNYTFQTVSDDGVRLWLGDQLVIDHWTDHGEKTDTAAPIALGAGQRTDVKLEYYERTGRAVVRLRWRPPGAVAAVPIPRTNLDAN